MKGILIFDHLNDVLFTKCDKKFAKHIQELAKLQGLTFEDKGDTECDQKPSPNIIIQLFSPIITSQHIMVSQFGNSYTSMQCKDGINMVFNEYMGYTFVYVATEEIVLMERTLGVCMSIVRHLCGPDVAILKTSRQKVSLVSSLLNAWIHLRSCEQSILTESIEQLSVNTDLASTTLKALRDASDKLKTQSEFSNVHVLVLVENKFLSLYSSKNAQDLSASDILLMILMCWVANKRENESSERNVDEDENFLLPRASTSKDDEGHAFDASTKLANPTSEDIIDLFGDSQDSSINESLSSYANGGLYSQLVLLRSEQSYTANAVHISKLAEGINLVTIIEVTNLGTSSGLYESFYHLNIVNGLQLQRDIDELKPAFENLDAAIKKTLDGIKKNRANINNDIDMCQRRLQVKWDFVRKKYTDLLRSRDLESILQIESNTSGFAETMRELIRLTCFDKNFLKQGTDVIMTVSRLVRQKLNDFSDFLKVKALTNFAARSGSSLTINKYLEEFPGLVHFIYIDRTTHRMTTPTLDFTSTETLALTTKKIWAMVEESRIHLQNRHLTVMWKDTTFNYGYFLWFEDSSGTPLKCKIYSNHLAKSLPLPGILCGNYYRKLAEACFPKISPNKIRIYELYCMHLGLTSSSSVLEHARRLAATIWEVKGLNNPADIF